MSSRIGGGGEWKEEWRVEWRERGKGERKRERQREKERERGRGRKSLYSCETYIRSKLIRSYQVSMKIIEN